MAGHKCKYALVMCVDFRFVDTTTSWASKLFGEKFDLFSWPGGVLPIVGKRYSIVSWFRRQVSLAYLGVFAKLHGGEEVVLVNHMDCGAYGGHKAFDSIEQEREKMKSDLVIARAIIIKRFPELKVRLYLLDPDNSQQMLRQVA